MRRTTAGRRWSVSALAAVVTAALLVVTGTGSATAAPGDLTTIAGGLGQGIATNIAQSPAAVAVRGPLVYTAEQRALVRVLDTRTGQTRVIAGDGRTAFRGDGGPATAASLSELNSIAVDGDGNVYVAEDTDSSSSVDYWNGRIRRIGTDGIITTIAGGGTSRANNGILATDAELIPRGMAFDGLGRLVFADLHRVVRIDPDGRLTTIAGDGTYGFSGDGGPAVNAKVVPYGVAYDDAGNLFIADHGNSRIRKVTPLGIISTVAGNGGFHPVLEGGPALESGFAYPAALALRNGSIYVNGHNNRSVRRIDPLGTVATVAGDGEYGSDGDGGPALAASFHAFGLAFDDAGNLYIADWFNRRLRRIAPDGIITTAAGNSSVNSGGDGGSALDAQFYAREMAYDSSGNLFLVEPGNSSVRRIDASGTITTVAHLSLGFTYPSFTALSGIALGPDGRIYLAESRRSRILRLEPSGELTVVAGGRYGTGGDGGLATEAEMYHPQALTFDAAGNLYVMDSYVDVSQHYGRIRRIDTAGIITTVVGPGSPNPDWLYLCPESDMAFDRDGKLLMTTRSSVIRVDLAGGRTPIMAGQDYQVDGGLAIESYTYCAGGVTSDAAGNIYVSNIGRVRRIDPSGRIWTIAGGGTAFPRDGSRAIDASLAPADLILATNGDLIISGGPYIHRLESVASAPVAPTTTTTTSTSTSTSTSTTSTSTSSTSTSTSTTSTSTSTTSTSTTTTTTVPAAATVRGWGLNHVGQLADGTADDRRTPVPVSTPRGATAVAAGFYHSLSLNSDRTVSAFGWNAVGQLGNGTYAASRVAVPVKGLTGVTQIAAGAYHNVALKSDGTVWTWGFNNAGQLGNGTTANSPVPLKVPGLSGVVAIGAGALHSLAVKSDGTVWAWGSDDHGQLGTAAGTNSRVPSPVVGLTGVSELTGGGYHSLARKSDGTVWAWGRNIEGQLGTASPQATVRVPAAISGLTGVRSIAAGLLHSVASKADGTAWAWGWNGVGPLGNGTTTESNVPVQVSGLTSVDRVAAAGHHSLALRSDGTVSAWGWNAYAQLGNGTLTNALTPVPVTGLTGARSVAAGVAHSLALGR